ncbi:type II toxin-antitoxin system RelB/DinJ family antitoxin [Veillonella caviae]|uniref:type II toxin-antitoxin system RelB/DinJ family antitoxin n=1 Tax=Veillonella caviae TaxID=248316 RepID=UPI0023A8CDBA|nr:type II toxin-antitoxin system RelB/DinJ family antitoxin [Veillonella caviae]MCI5709469.1 type II toxin-antitoxin system RelB/DinJ family antitoxin [Veillonella caviae]MDY5714341.1 type II toxin-antitoxin system RelB/DinJ family antitoxin [Veillonella caviae]MDY5787665.1 type II toxin-antitoxin system RelB/DinJ family antitoxin [Veillonella caviae]
MATVPTQIRIDADIKKQATDLFSTLGLDMSSAVNIFLNQCVLRGGIPFSVEVPQYSHEVLEAMEEAKRISRDSDIPGYTNMAELKKALEA